jgi:rfaE bifunctional protein nucleotidyltransferase chain/domain
MDNILTPEESITVASSLKNKGKKIVLAGGCFDIIHIGHTRFLEKAKKEGDVLLVLLESDASVRKLKGKERPINSQAERAEILSHIRPVDFVILLPDMQFDESYDKLITQIGPDVLAVTEGDTGIDHKRRQAGLIGAEIRMVLKRIKSKSTTSLIQIFKR